MIKIIVKEKFELSNGTTILPCICNDLSYDAIGKKYRLIIGDDEKQTLTIVGEQKMLKAKSNSELRAFQTYDKVLLSSSDISTNQCFLIPS